MKSHFLTWLLIVLLGITGSIGCTSQMEPANIVPPTNLTNTPLSSSTITPSYIDPLPHLPYDLESVECGDVLSGGQEQEYWTDSLVPGLTTLKDVIQQANVSGVEDTSKGFKRYRVGNVTLIFWQEILVEKNDMRQKLADILVEYGEPSQIIWDIPLSAYHNAGYRTLLLYSELGTLFYTEKQVVYFDASTLFEYSRAVAPSEFDELVSTFTEHKDVDDYIYFSWPCSDIK